MPKDMQVYLAVLVVLLPAIFWFGRWMIRTAPPATPTFRAVTLDELFVSPVPFEPVKAAETVGVAEPVVLAEPLVTPDVAVTPVRVEPCSVPDLILSTKARHEITWAVFAAEVGVSPSTLRGWAGGREPNVTNRERLLEAIARLDELVVDAVAV